MLEAKFHGLTDQVLGLERSNALIQACWKVGVAPDVRGITALACADH
jgi:hypothetical protein